MCGIVGVAGDVNIPKEKMFKHLLILDSLRGIDSTGVCGVHNDPDAGHTVVKCVGDPFQLMDMAKFNDVFKWKQSVLIGHNRFATVGKITRNTAHPFEFDKVVGVHNGTLHNKYALLDGNKFDVDSQALYWNINEKGVKEAIGTARGAWSLVWWNKEEQRLQFLRNQERPMFIGTIKGGKSIAWASEKWMLEVAAARNDVAFEQIDETNVDTLYSFKVEKGDIKIDSIEGGYKGAPEPVSNVRFFSGGATSNSRVVTPPQQVTGTQAQVVSESYFSKKIITFIAHAVKVDQNGSTYLECIAPAHSNVAFRWYMHKADPADQYVGRKYTGVAGMFFNVTLKDGSHQYYYKMEYGTVRLDKSHQEAAEQEDTKPEEEEAKYLGAKGVMLSHSDWVKEHGRCSWCNADITPDQHHRFSRTGTDILCADCMSDPEISQYVKG